ALLRRTSLPIYPVGIAGAHRALGKGSRFLKPHRVCVVFGEPLSRKTIEPLCQRGREDELVESVRDRIAACQRECEEWLGRGAAPWVAFDRHLVSACSLSRLQAALVRNAKICTIGAARPRTILNFAARHDLYEQNRFWDCRLRYDFGVSCQSHQRHP